MILLTGYGSIGSLVAKKIISDYSPPMLIIDKNEETIHYAAIKYKNAKHIIPLVADMTNPNDINRIFSYPIESVVHTAAMKHVTLCENNPSLATTNNIIGTNNLIEATKRRGNVKTFINVSTDKSACPTNVMGATKFIIERLIMSHRDTTATKFQSVRLGNVLFSNGSLIPTLIENIRLNKKFRVTDPRATRFYITPEAAGNFITNALHGTYSGQTIIKKLDAADLDTMVRATFDLLNKQCEYDVIGLQQGEKLHEHLFTESEHTHMLDNGDHWSIDFDHKSAPIDVIDSSQFCVSYDKFKDVLSNVWTNDTNKY